LGFEPGEEEGLMGDITRLRGLVLSLAIVLALAAIESQTAQAQTFQVIHNFTGGQDGATPYSGLTVDKVGNLYGSALYDGGGKGTIFQLKHKGAGWVFNVLYSFTGGDDGAGPQFKGGALVFGPDGTIFGTTNGGGGGTCDGSGAPYPGCGTVFNLRPPPTACKSALCPWMETVLHRFTGTNDGFNPEGSLLFDQAGNIYGTTIYGGLNGFGTIYELTPSAGSWTETVAYDFGSDGHYPISGVIMDDAGNFYGTTYLGGSVNIGTAFQLVPSNGSLTENFHYSFLGGQDGGRPIAGLIFDQSGNLYGAASDDGINGGGTFFQLLPGSGNNWTLQVLYSFAGGPSDLNGCGPWGPLVIQRGSIYGTTKCAGAHGYGNVFELSPSNGGWSYTSLYDFTGGSDGAYPISNVVFDANGNLYGSASAGGSSTNCTGGCGVVWEITP
jgi:uncharacterized repeat protein (TIGR03803 family)